MLLFGWELKFSETEMTWQLTACIHMRLQPRGLRAFDPRHHVVSNAQLLWDQNCDFAYFRWLEKCSCDGFQHWPKINILVSMKGPLYPLTATAPTTEWGQSQHELEAPGKCGYSRLGRETLTICNYQIWGGKFSTKYLRVKQSLTSVRAVSHAESQSQASTHPQRWGCSGPTYLPGISPGRVRSSGSNCSSRRRRARQEAWPAPGGGPRGAGPQLG